MIKKQYSGSARRARNIIWNAAGRYDFEPPFMAFFPNGTPDLYFDMIVGFAEKWLDLDAVWAFFRTYEGDRRAEEFDEFLWLGIENCVYEKEVRERPVLADLRRARAARFYEEQANLSRQQMEYQSMPVYTQQEARWAEVLGKKAPVMTPRERKMADMLRFSGDCGTEEVIAAMRTFLQTFFRYSGESVPHAQKKPSPLAKLLLRKEHERKDRFIIRTGTGEGDHERAVSLGHLGLGRHRLPTAEDEAYIRTVFGECSLTDHERRILQNELCVREDEDCRIWVTKAAPGKAHAEGSTSADGAGTESSGRAQKEAAEAARARQKQHALNTRFRMEHAAQIKSAEKNLTARMETVLSSYLRHLPEPARAGRICPEKAYRLPTVQDGRVFLKDGEETEQDIFVDLLLDASQSRMNSQEVLAAEAFIIAKSLTNLHIPVRVCSFRSLRGYTVLDVLKEAGDRDCSGTFSYYAGGWNRDSLALKLAGRLDDDPVIRGKRRLLLIMTDASPNDSAPLAGADRLLPQEYEGAAAVNVTRETVRALTEAGIRTGAVFHGNTSHVADLHTIYGSACVRIRGASRLAQGVGDLLLMMLREMRKD